MEVRLLNFAAYRSRVNATSTTSKEDGIGIRKKEREQKDGSSSKRDQSSYEEENDENHTFVIYA